MDIYINPQDIPFDVPVLVKHKSFKTPFVVVREIVTPSLVDVPDADIDPDAFNHGCWRVEDIDTWCHLPPL